METLAQAQVYFTEIDMHELEKWRRFQQLPAGQRLDDPKTISQETWLRLKNAAKRFGWPESVDLANTAIYSLTTWFNTKLRGSFFLDDELEQLAQQNKIEVRGLETAVDRESTLKPTFNDERTLKSVLGTIEHLPSLDQAQLDKWNRNLENVIKYREGDLDWHWNNVFQKGAFSGRHKEWLSQIEKAAGERKAFFAVGIAHVTGEDGLVQLLRRRGWTVTLVEGKESKLTGKKTASLE